MALKKHEVETEGLQPVQVSDRGASSRVARIQEVGNAVRELQAAVAPMSQRSTAMQAQQRGQADALSGNFKPQRDATLASQEYNRAGFDTALGELEITMRTRIDTIFEESKHNPAELKTKLDAYRAEVEGNLGSDDMKDVLPQFRSMYERAALPHLRASVQNNQQATAASNASMAMSLLEARANDAERFARSSDIDGAAQLALLEESQQFDDLLIKHGPKEGFAFNGVQYEPDPTRSGVFSPIDMEKHSQEWDERMTQAAVLGGFDRAIGIAEKEAYVNAFEAKEKGRKGSPFNLDQVDQLANRMRIDINKERAKSDQFRTALEKQIRDAEKVYMAGKNPVGITALRKAAAAYPDLAAELDSMKEDSGHAANFSQLIPSQQQQILNSLKNTTVASAREVKLTERLEKINTETEQLLNEDPVTLLARNQVMDISPVNLADPATIGNRADEAGMLKSYYGIRHHGLTAAEVTGLSTIIENNSADVNAGYLAGIRAGMDDDRLLALMRDLMPKNPEFAAAAGVAVERDDIAADILRGVDVLKLNTGITPDSAQLIAINDDFFEDSVVGENRVMIERAALALDAARRDKAGIKSKDDFKEGDYKQALNDVTGGVFRWHGKKIIAPMRGIEPDDFADMMDALEPADIEGMHNGSFKVQIEDFRKRARLQSLENGKYLVLMADGFATDSRGQPYELDLRGKIPALKARLQRRPTIHGAELVN